MFDEILESMEASNPSFIKAMDKSSKAKGRTPLNQILKKYNI